MRYLSLITILLASACTDLSENQNNGEELGSYDHASTDIDADGFEDGYDQDELLGPIADYPGEIHINIGALDRPWFGEAMTFSCMHENGQRAEMWWGFYQDSSDYQDTWLVTFIDDRIPEGSVLCEITMDGKPVLNIRESDNLAWTTQSICVHQDNNGTYQSPSYSECDGMRLP